MYSREMEERTVHKPVKYWRCNVDDLGTKHLTDKNSGIQFWKFVIVIIFVVSDRIHVIDCLPNIWMLDGRIVTCKLNTL